MINESRRWLNYRKLRIGYRAGLSGIGGVDVKDSRHKASFTLMTTVGWPSYDDDGSLGANGGT